MKKYKNVSGKSGVSGYEIGKDFILIQFVNSKETYVYNYVMPGKETVEQMKTLARRGQGLSTFISQFVKDDYFKKY